uniref:BHLH domain-containing protein n=1 Tax=Kalanchoe fedtschenkoi TaxID=63787 RepID=A0A7N0UUG4_KALFE
MEDDCLHFDFLDYDFINDTLPSDLCWLNQSACPEVQLNSTSCASNERESTGDAKESTRKRLRTKSCCKAEMKALREKLRRERFNDKLLELSSIIDPARLARSDKVAILDDAIRILKQLKTEAQELEEARKKLNDEINNLKAEKYELREEKVTLKAEKERIEQQMKLIAPASFVPSHPASYHPVANKMPVIPGYGLVPMWRYLPTSAVDTSKDHELRPPAA